mmetsp:Transcript_22552/g.36308  ORF Transcript_22552/g.36308 Transcript_22552/m.36308 type:complete len:100 (-) Transcript_22552:110-409(-)
MHAEETFFAAMKAGRAEGDGILAADEAEGHPHMDANMLQLACCVKYDCYWRGLALRLLNGEQWWQTSAGDLLIFLCTQPPGFQKNETAFQRLTATIMVF